MTRETKVGLVVAGSFLCLVCVVVASKMRRGDDPSEEQANSVAAVKPLQNGNLPEDKKPEAHKKPDALPVIIKPGEQPTDVGATGGTNSGLAQSANNNGTPAGIPLQSMGARTPGDDEAMRKKLKAAVQSSPSVSPPTTYAPPGDSFTLPAPNANNGAPAAPPLPIAPPTIAPPTVVGGEVKLPPPNQFALNDDKNKGPFPAPPVMPVGTTDPSPLQLPAPPIEKKEVGLPFPPLKKDGTPLPEVAAPPLTFPPPKKDGTSLPEVAAPPLTFPPPKKDGTPLPSVEEPKPVVAPLPPPPVPAAADGGLKIAAAESRAPRRKPAAP